MKCEICRKKILRDSQYINYKYYHNDCIENLQQENKQLKETYKEVFNNYQSLKEKNETLTSLNIYQSDKIQHLKDNWNELKKYAKENLYFYSGYQREDLEIDISIQEILNKMQELEQGSDSNENN